MSHYTEVLEEARNQATSSAKEYIPKLYHILVDEEHKTAEDARGIIEHDLLDYWSKATVGKYLPQETKDEEKVKAGVKGAKATNLVLAGGQSVTINSDGLDSVSPKGNDKKKENPPPPEDPKDTEIQFLKDENSFLKEKVSELEEALKKTQQFKPANALEGEGKENFKGVGFEFLREMADGVHSFYYDAYGIDLFKNRELPQLKNSGVKVFRRLYFEV